MARTITGNNTIGVTLSAASDNPVTVTGTISKASGALGSLYARGGAGVSWTITNENTGLINGQPSAGGAYIGGFSSSVTNAVLVNSGNIRGNLYALFVNGPSTITNNSGATIAANTNAVMYLRGVSTVTNSGVIYDTLNTGIYLSSGGRVVNNAGATIFAAAIAVRANAVTTVVNYGTIIGNSTNAVFLGASSANNRIIMTPSARFTGRISGGAGVIQLAAGDGSLGTTPTFQSTGISNIRTIQIDPGARWVIPGNTSAAGLGTLTITGLNADSTINVRGFTAASASFAANKLTLTNSASANFTMNVIGTFSSGDFVLASDGAGGTFVTTCYRAGTMIWTEAGEVAVERLKIGDYLITLSGEARRIKWIGRRSYTRPFPSDTQDVQPIKISAGALGNDLPRRDLYVSARHAIYLENVLIPAELLVNDVSIVRCPDINFVEYFHIELESHDVIFAEGAAAETFVDCDSRMVFNNATEFTDLYPMDTPPRWTFIAPRLEKDCEMLRRIHQQVAQLAGLRDENKLPEQELALQGGIDVFEPSLIAGWAWTPEAPTKRVVLDVLDGEGVIARITADQYRADLEEAGKGDGRHGFRFELERPLVPWRKHHIRIRRAADGLELDSRVVPEALSPGELLQDKRFGAAVEAASRGARTVDEVDDMLRVLLTQVDRVRQTRALLVAHPTLALPEFPMQQPAPTPKVLRRQEEPRAGRALVIDDAAPVPGRDAASKALFGHMLALRKLGYELEFVAGADVNLATPPANLLPDLPVVWHSAPLITSVEEVLRRSQNGFRVVYLNRYHNVRAYGGLIRRWCPGAQIVYNVADLHHLRIGRQAEAEGRPELLDSVRRLKQLELFAMREVDVVLTHSSVERDYLAAEAPGAKVHVVGWPVELETLETPFSERSDVTFVGWHEHQPNRDAVIWLIREIMPKVWEQTPDINCFIVGHDWPDSYFREADPRIRLIGPVPHLGTVLTSSRLTVAPLRFGAGIKGKVLDSFAAGVPCVMSPIAAEGLPLNEDLASLVGETSSDLAALICRLHENEVVNRSASRAGSAMIRGAFNLEQVTRDLAGSLAN
jgi:hypothetical protein